MKISASKKVEILLFKSLRGYGVPGSKVKAARGFIRNKLIPAGIADYATDVNVKKFASMKADLAKQDAENVKKANELKAQIEGIELVFFCKVRENANIYGSIQSREIEAELKTKDFNINKSQIILSAPLKVLGEYDVAIELYGDLDASIKVILKSLADQPVE